MAVFYSGGDALFDARLYGEPHPSSTQFLMNQFQNATQALTSASQAFYEQARACVEHAISDENLRQIKAMARSVRHLFTRDAIQPLMDMGQLQFAPSRMQRWIMAEPETRQLYHQQRIDGYSDTYVDLYPGQVGEDHVDYRRIMNGIVQVDSTDADEVPEWRAVSYWDEEIDSEPGLSLEEQNDILDTWWAMREWRKATNEDYTSRYCNDIE